MGLTDVLKLFREDHYVYTQQQRTAQAKARETAELKAQQARITKRQRIESLEEAALLMQQLDKAIGLKGLMQELQHTLNAQRGSGSLPWKLVKISRKTYYRSFRHPDKIEEEHEKLRIVNGLPEGADGYALMRRLSREREGLFGHKDRYAYIFVGRFFKGLRDDRTLLPVIDDKNIGTYDLFSGETARYYKVARTVPSRRGAVADIWDHSPLTTNSYGSLFEPSQIHLGAKTDIVSHMHDPSWLISTRERFGCELGRIIRNTQAYNLSHGRKSLL